MRNTHCVFADGLAIVKFVIRLQLVAIVDWVFASKANQFGLYNVHCGAQQGIQAGLPLQI